jgi:hypothetical protein
MASTTQTFAWQPLPEMPTKRVYGAAAVQGDRLFVFGGCDIRGRPLDAADMFDTKAMKWQSLKKMQSPRASFNAVSLTDERVAVIGGVDALQKPVGDVDVYDFTCDEWRTLTSIPTPVLGPSVVKLDDHNVIIAGGNKEDHTASNNVWQLDTESGTLEELDPLPTARHACVGILSDRQLYVVGGRIQKFPSSALEVLDLDKNKWTVLDAMPNPRLFPSVVCATDSILVIGGADPEKGCRALTEGYNLESKTWKKLRALELPRVDFSAGVFEGSVVVAGGFVEQDMNATADAEMLPQGEEKWKPLPPMPSARMSATCINFQDSLLVIGGIGVKGPSSEVAALKKIP